jgi:hypothetical protein
MLEQEEVHVLMSTDPANPLASESALSSSASMQTGRTSRMIGWSSLLFAVLQSVCSFFTALDGVRLVVGAGSLTSIVAAGEVWDKFHTNWIRVPMVGFALVGSVANLALLMQIRRLRRRPAAQWRQIPLTPRKIRMERMQLIVSLLTLVLLAVEEVTHFRTFHKF